MSYRQYCAEGQKYRSMPRICGFCVRNRYNGWVAGIYLLFGYLTLRVMDRQAIARVHTGFYMGTSATQRDNGFCFFLLLCLLFVFTFSLPRVWKRLSVEANVGRPHGLYPLTRGENL